MKNTFILNFIKSQNIVMKIQIQKNSKVQKFNTNVRTQYRPSYPQYSQPFQSNFN